MKMRKLIFSLLLGVIVAGASFIQSLTPNERVEVISKIEAKLPGTGPVLSAIAKRLS